MQVNVKRVYDVPSKTDGTRVLADRLWPRGVTKRAAHIDVWIKELTPSTKLRSWFHKDPKGRYKEFVSKYKKELGASKQNSKTLLRGRKGITLVTSVKDIEHSHIPVLAAFLKKI